MLTFKNRLTVALAMNLIVLGARAADCPAPGTAVPIAKAMNPSFLKDFKGCDIAVEARFMKVGTPTGFRIGYDTKRNTTFQVLEPNGSPQSAFGESIGLFAAVPKDASDVLFQLKPGDLIVLRGSPIALSSKFRLGSAGAALFVATSVVRKQ
jgi:hypothetical protein